MIDTRLKVFRSVATHLSFTKAANELFVSQPAISKHIQELEKEYSVRLFDRTGGRVRLTQAGQLMLRHACEIVQAYQSLDYEMKRLTAKAEGELRLGASTTISQYVLPEMLAAFRKRYPAIRLTLLSGNSYEVEDALLGGRIDLGMVEGTRRQPHFKYTPFMDDELVAIVNARSPLAEKDEVGVEELGKIPVVLRELGSGTLDVIRDALGACGVSLSDLRVELSFGTTEGIKHFVAHSDCMGIVSVRAVSQEVYAGLFKILEIEGCKMTRQLCFVEKRGETAGLARVFKKEIAQGYSA